MSREEKIRGLFSKDRSAGRREIVLASPLTGQVIPLDQVKDETFASGILGDGVAIFPAVGELRAPADGVVEQTFESAHAITLVTREGVELLLHVGIDTVRLGGKHFEPLVHQGDDVKAGDVLLRFDKAAIEAAGYEVTTPMIISNSDAYQISTIVRGDVGAGMPLLRLIQKEV